MLASRQLARPTGGVTGRLTGAGMLSQERNNPAAAMVRWMGQFQDKGAAERKELVGKLDDLVKAIRSNPLVQSLLGQAAGNYGGGH